jgi:hypothetical protein
MSIIASACAARELGYPGTATLIIERQLSPGAIVRLFSMGASHDAGHDAAVIVLAAATARFNSCRDGFDGSVERDLAVHQLGDESLLAAADREAVKLVAQHWREIVGSCEKAPAVEARALSQPTTKKTAKNDGCSSLQRTPDHLSRRSR